MNTNEYYEVMKIVSEELLGIHLIDGDKQFGYEIMYPTDSNNIVYVDFDPESDGYFNGLNLIDIYNSISRRLWEYIIDNEKKES